MFNVKKFGTAAGILVVMLMILAAAAFVVMPGQAMAEEAPPVVTPDAPSAWQSALGTLIAGIVGTAATALAVMLIAGIKALTTYLNKKAAFLMSAELKAKLDAAVETGVLKVKQTYVDALKSAASDGKLTKDEAREALGLAKAEILNLLKLKNILVDNTEIESLVEAKLASMKL